MSRLRSAGDDQHHGGCDSCNAVDVRPYGGRVYGIWAEAAPENYQVTPSGRGSAAPARPRRPTIIRVGTADFSGTQSTSR